MIFAAYSQGNSLRAVMVDRSGAVAEDFELVDRNGKVIASPDPIDIAVDAAGRIYMATLPRSNGIGKLLRLDPAGVQRQGGLVEAERQAGPKPDPAVMKP